MPAVLSVFSRVRLCVTLWTVARQAPLSLRLSRQESWSGLPCPPPGDLPDLGIEFMSPVLASGFLTTGATWKRQGTPLLLLLLLSRFSRVRLCVTT